MGMRYSIGRAFLSEANVTSLAQRYKLPLPAAQKINDFSAQNADTITKLITMLYPNIVKMGEEAATEFIDDELREPWAVHTRKFLTQFPAKKDDLVSMVKAGYNVDDVENFLMFGEERGATSVVDLSNGWRWVEVSERRREGIRMRHCGSVSTPGGSMLSLRDDLNRPHVTMEVRGKTIVQARGKRNSCPEEKYWPMIKALVDKEQLDPSHISKHYVDEDGTCYEQLKAFLSR